MTNEDTVYDTEDILLVLFDAHQRVSQYELQGRTLEEREFEQKARDHAASVIAETAVDWIERNEDLLKERYEKRQE